MTGSSSKQHLKEAGVRVCPVPSAGLAALGNVSQHMSEMVLGLGRNGVKFKGTAEPDLKLNIMKTKPFTD